VDKLYAEVHERLDLRTNVLTVRYSGGRLDGVVVEVHDRELRRREGRGYGPVEFEPVDVDALAQEIVGPASETVIEGLYAVVQPSRLALPASSTRANG